MAIDSVQKDFIGLIVRATIVDEDGDAVDVSGATTKELHFQKPDGTGVEKSAAFTTDGTNGQVEYVTASGDLNIAGRWSVQAYVITAGGLNGHSASHQFDVTDNLAVP